MIGISTGSAFALVGIGMVLIHRTSGIVNFAQGSFAVLGGLFMVRLADDLPSGIAGLVTVVIVAVVGAVMGLIAVGIRGRTTALASLIITLGLALVVSSLELLEFGDRPHTYPAVSEHAWNVRGVVIQPQYALVIGVTIAASLLLALALRRTIVGHALVACADSSRAAELVGLNVRTLAMIAFAVSAGLAALGGLLVTPVVPVNYDSDVAIAVNAFAAAAFGGLGSIGFAFVGGLVLGISEQLVVGYVDPQYNLAIALVIMLVLIGWRSRHEAVT